jgi:hypothetical protein
MFNRWRKRSKALMLFEFSMVTVQSLQALFLLVQQP